MNREDRRKNEKSSPQGGRVHRTIPEEKLDAEVQDFMAGTIFAAGAAGIRPEEFDEDSPPLFVVLLNKDNLTPAPELLDLLRMVEDQGTIAINQQLRGTTRWGTMPTAHNQMLAKLELNLTSPIKTHPSLLLIADNYKEIWDIPATEGYLLGITTMEKFAALTDSSTYADALELCVLITPPPSNAARALNDHYTAAQQPKKPSPVLMMTTNDDTDDMRYQVGIRTNFLGHASEAVLLLRPTGLTQITMGETVAPTLFSDTYAHMGLHRDRKGQPVPVAQGWTWELQGQELTVLDSTGTLAVSCELAHHSTDASWSEIVRTCGFFTLYVGDELVMDDDRSLEDQIAEGRNRNNLVSGIIHHTTGPWPTPGETPAPPIEDSSPKPLLKRLFRR